MKNQLFAMYAVIAVLSLVIGFETLSRMDIPGFNVPISGNVVAEQNNDLTFEGANPSLFIKASYIYMLDRPATQDEISFGTAYLASHNREDYLLNELYILNAMYIYNTFSMDDAKFVKFLYYHLLKSRTDPQVYDQASFDSHVDSLGKGFTRKDLVKTYFIYNNNALKKGITEKMEYLNENGVQ